MNQKSTLLDDFEKKNLKRNNFFKDSGSNGCTNTKSDNNFDIGILSANTKGMLYENNGGSRGT